MVNPALINMAEARKVDALNLQNMPFYGHDHFHLVKALLTGIGLEFDPTGRNTNYMNTTTSFGSIKKGFKIVPGIGIVPSDQVAKLIQIQQKKIWTGIVTLARKQSYDSDNKKLKAAAKSKGIIPTLPLTELEQFNWYSNVEEGSTDQLDDKLEEGPIREEDFTLDRIIKEVSHAETMRKILAWGSKITPYRVWQIQSPDSFNATFSSRLEILQEISTNVYYDLYVDAAGNVQYHPYRFANDYFSYDAIYGMPGAATLHKHPIVWPGIYVVAPEESINHNEIVNFDELITFLKLRGHDPNSAVEADIGNIVGRAMHKKYLERFGYRRALDQNPLFNFNFSLDPSANNLSEAGVTFMDLVAASLLIYKNGTLHTKDSTIIFRPEMDIARPIYYPEDDMVFYIDGISHSITIGGDATTTITASFGRKIHESPLDLQTFLLIQEGLWKFGAQNFDLQDFLSKLPIEEWQNFLDKEQYRSLQIANDHAKAVIFNREVLGYDSEYFDAVNTGPEPLGSTFADEFPATPKLTPLYTAPNTHIKNSKGHS